ncbi:MAG: YcfL family protein [Verrucomicrobia bacterium]|nr:YcfL family protein [Verrucomicrobiota bacterium]
MKNTLVCLMVLLCFGCAGEGPYVPAQRQPSPELENTAVILDESLADRIAVDSQNAEHTAQGKLKGMANVRNRTNQDLSIQVQTVFRDDNGFSIGDDTAWETVILTANETRTISATSTSKKAERYTIRVRETR